MGEGPHTHTSVIDFHYNVTLLNENGSCRRFVQLVFVATVW